MRPKNVFPVLRRRRVLSARLPARALGTSATGASGRQAGGVAGQPPAGGARGRHVIQSGPQAGHGRHYCAAKAITFPTDQAAAPGNQGDQPPGERARGRAPAVLSWYCQHRGNDGFRLRPCRQFKRHHRQLRILRSRLGRIIREIRRKIEGQSALENAFNLPLGRATQIRAQRQRQRGCSCILSTPRTRSASAMEGRQCT